jgi:hypothetical protein
LGFNFGRKTNQTEHICPHSTVDGDVPDMPLNVIEKEKTTITIYLDKTSTKCSYAASRMRTSLYKWRFLQNLLVLRVRVDE